MWIRLFRKREFLSPLTVRCNGSLTLYFPNLLPINIRPHTHTTQSLAPPDEDRRIGRNWVWSEGRSDSEGRQRKESLGRGGCSDPLLPDPFVQCFPQQNPSWVQMVGRSRPGFISLFLSIFDIRLIHSLILIVVGLLDSFCYLVRFRSLKMFQGWSDWVLVESSLLTNLMKLWFQLPYIMSVPLFCQFYVFMILCLIWLD